MNTIAPIESSIETENNTFLFDFEYPELEENSASFMYFSFEEIDLKDSFEKSFSIIASITEEKYELKEINNRIEVTIWNTYRFKISQKEVRNGIYQVSMIIDFLTNNITEVYSYFLYWLFYDLQTKNIYFEYFLDRVVDPTLISIFSKYFQDGDIKKYDLWEIKKVKDIDEGINNTELILKVILKDIAIFYYFLQEQIPNFKEYTNLLQTFNEKNPIREEDKIIYQIVENSLWTSMENFTLKLTTFENWLKNLAKMKTLKQNNTQLENDTTLIEIENDKVKKQIKRIMK